MGAIDRTIRTSGSFTNRSLTSGFALGLRLLLTLPFEGFSLLLASCLMRLLLLGALLFGGMLTSDFDLL